jgi:hypothetical protein
MREVAPGLLGPFPRKVLCPARHVLGNAAVANGYVEDAREHVKGAEHDCRRARLRILAVDESTAGLVTLVPS